MVAAGASAPATRDSVKQGSARFETTERSTAKAASRSTTVAAARRPGKMEICGLVIVM